MAISDILAQLEDEKEKALEQIKKEFEEELEKLNAEYEEKRKAQANSIKDRTSSAKMRIKDKAETTALMENKNELLKGKRKLLNKVFEKLVEELVSSSNNSKFLEGLVQKIAKEYKEGELIPSKGQKENVEKAAKGTNFKISSETTDKKGGFIFRSGQVQIDSTYESIVESQMRDDLESETSNILFA